MALSRALLVAAVGIWSPPLDGWARRGRRKRDKISGGGKDYCIVTAGVTADASNAASTRSGRTPWHPLIQHGPYCRWTRWLLPRSRSLGTFRRDRRHAKGQADVVRRIGNEQRVRQGGRGRHRASDRVGGVRARAERCTGGPDPADQGASLEPLGPGARPSPKCVGGRGQAYGTARLAHRGGGARESADGVGEAALIPQPMR